MTVNIAELLGQADSLFKSAAAIVSNPVAASEEQAKVPRMLEDARKAKADALSLMEIAKEGTLLADLMKGNTGGSNQQQTPPDTSKGFQYWGEFLEAVYETQKGGKPDPRLVYFKDEQPSGNTRSEKDMSGSTGASGGYLIPVEQLTRLMAAMGEASIVRRYATIIPMRRRQISIPALDQTQVLAPGVPRWFGGLQFYWIGEGEQKPESDPKFREINLVAKKLVGFTRSSDELLDDAAISLEAFLQGPLGFAGGAAWMEDYAWFWGKGAAQPLGIFNSPAVISIKRDVSGKIKYDDLVRMMSAAMPSANLRWTISQTVLADLMNMVDGDGRLIWATATEGGAKTLLGLPYTISEKLPPKGTTGDVLLADFSFYLIGDRQAVTVESTKFEAWQYDKTSWRMVDRVDGQPWLNAPFTYQDTTTQVSPFVQLSSDVS